MALDPTAREANFKDSIKKYFVETLKDIENLNLSFDKSLSTPYLQGVSVNKWVIINWGHFLRDTLSEATINILPCVRQDNEGFQLAQLSDKILGYLTDTSATHGMKTITFYRSYPNQVWTVLGGLMVWDIIESGTLEASDETKYKIITVRFKFASKI